MTLSRKVCYFCLLLLVCLSVSFAFISYSGYGGGYLAVTLLDVGQGDAIFIETPSGGQFIVDGGPGSALMSELSHVMPFYDRSIDGIMVTNPDTDHYSGFIKVLDRYEVGMMIESGTRSDTPMYKVLKNSVSSKGVRVVTANRGMKIMLDTVHGVYLDILFPDRDVSRLSSNDGSIVAKLVYKDASMMLQGDSPQKIEKYLLDLDSSDLDADVLKLGHHGSKTSTLSEYVKAVSPEYAMASLGRDNRYGHPHQEVLDTLVSLGVPLFRTDTDGRITFISDGRSFVRR